MVDFATAALQNGVSITQRVLHNDLFSQLYEKDSIDEKSNVSFLSNIGFPFILGSIVM
jgi:hypothetical protein